MTRHEHASGSAARRAVPGIGSYWVGRRYAPTSLRCSHHEGGCGTARRGAERATTSWLLAGPALQGRTSPCAAALLAAPQVAHPGYRPPRGTPRGVGRRTSRCIGKAVVGCASAATLCGAEHRRARGRARAARASTSDSRRLFEHSERSERSEFRRGPCDREPEGSRPAGSTAAHERRRIPGRGFARSVSAA